MVTLSNIQGGSLAVNLAGPAQTLQTFFGQQREDQQLAQQQAQAQAQAQAQQNAILAQLELALPESGGGPAGSNAQQRALARIMSINKDVGTGILNVVKFGQEARQARNVEARAQGSADAAAAAADLNKQALKALRNAKILSDKTSGLTKAQKIKRLVDSGDMPVERALELNSMDDDTFDFEVGVRVPTVAQDLKMLTTAPKAVKPTADEERTQQLINTGLSRAEANRIVSGRDVVITDPVAGRTSLLDVATAETTAAQPSEAGAPAADIVPIEGKKTLWQQSEQATGVGATVKRGLTDVVGQVPGAVGRAAQFPETVDAQTNVDLFQRNIIQAMSLNDRYPVFEQQRLMALLPTGAFTSPATLKVAYRNFDDELARIEQETERGKNNSRQPAKQQEADRVLNGFIKQTRARLGVPKRKTGRTRGDIGRQDATTAASAPQTKAEFDALPAGTVFIGLDGRTYRK